jgi:nitric oxide synthase oxygenase domain/subunit
MFELYQNLNSSRGSLAEVWIDRSAKLVKKLYKPDGITIRGTPPHHSSLEEIESLYRNEVYWSTTLRSPLVLEIYEHGALPNQGWYIVQEYVGTNLLDHYRLDTRLSHIIPNAAEQIVEMFGFWQQHNMHKINNAMCNMVWDGTRIRAFDFKYARPRTDQSRIKERRSLTEWIAKIDPSLVQRLELLI